MLSSFKSSPCIVLVTHRPVNTVLRIRPCTQRYKEKRASVCLFPVASVPGFPWLSGVWSTGCACVSLAPRVVVLLQSYPLSRWKRHMFLWILFWKWCLPCLFSILYDAYNPYISIFFWLLLSVEAAVVSDIIKYPLWFPMYQSRSTPAPSYHVICVFSCTDLKLGESVSF